MVFIFCWNQSFFCYHVVCYAGTSLPICYPHLQFLRRRGVATGGKGGDRQDRSACCRPRRQRCVPTRMEEPRSKAEHEEGGTEIESGARCTFFFCCETQIERVKCVESDARALTGPAVRPVRRRLSAPIANGMCDLYGGMGSRVGWIDFFYYFFFCMGWVD